MTTLAEIYAEALKARRDLVYRSRITTRRDWYFELATANAHCGIAEEGGAL